MSSTKIEWGVGAKQGVVNGQLRQTTGNRLFKLASVSYPIMAASVCAELQTNKLSILIKESGAVAPTVIMLSDDLPDTPVLTLKLNSAINEAFTDWLAAGNKVPAYKKTSKGYVWYNPTADDVVIEFHSSNMEQLILGRTLARDAALNRAITLTPNETSEPFKPDSRLGAVTQNLIIQPCDVEIPLPLSGDFRTSIFIAYTDHIIKVNDSGITATVRVEYPSINTTVVVSNSVRSTITVYTSHLNK